MRHSREDEVLRIGCAFALAVFVLVFIACLPWIDELVGEVEQLERDHAESSR
jgi:hypothetical protein